MIPNVRRGPTPLRHRLDPKQTTKAPAGIRMAHKNVLDLAQHAVVEVENLPSITLAVLQSDLGG